MPHKYYYIGDNVMLVTRYVCFKVTVVVTVSLLTLI